MANLQIGKLKLHGSKRGVAYKWGDGEIHRLSFERKSAANAPYDDTADPGGYAQPSYGASQDGYDGDGAYYDQERPAAGRYDVLYQSDWLMYVCLVLLPPLGIWILWQRERFAPRVRSVITLVSAAWFILLLVWLFMALLNTGGQDPITSGVNPSTITAPTPTPAGGATKEGSEDLTVSPSTAPLTNPIATPRPNTESTLPSEPSGTTGSTTTNESAAVVYGVSTGKYYHRTLSCPNIEEGAVQMRPSLAESMGLTPCSTCYEVSPETTYYMTVNGKFYHTKKNCNNMKNPQSVTLAQAKSAGKDPCPTCIGSVWATKDGTYYHKTSSCSGMKNAQLVTVAAAKAAKKTACPKCLKASASTAKTYYSKAGGKYYHTKANCSGMTGASKVTAAVIKSRNQTACPKCVSTASSTASKVYATKAGNYYHTKSDCSGMKGATLITLATAKKNGKKACPTCVGTSGTGTKTASTAAVYYATSAGKYYHKTATCSGMTGAKKVTKAAAEKNGKTACPTCLKDNATYTYATSGGKYYHKTATCSGMTNAKRVTLATAKSSGKTACPVCYKSASAKATYYYATRLGRYYHKTATCSGMKNASKITLASALANGKSPCPTCLKAQDRYYYATKAGNYYHTKSNCSGMTNASKITGAAAVKAGKKACPICVKGANVVPTATPKNKVYCFASSGSRYYHKNRLCSGLKNAKKVLLSTAKNKGKTACPICVTKKVKATNLTTSFADKQTIAYASGSSAYYHKDKNCVAGLKKTTVAAAKNKGKGACPSCAKGLNTYVFVTRSGTKYHRKSTCSGAVNSYKISLTTALKLNYVRCTKCNAPRKP